MISNPIRPSATVSGSRQSRSRTLAIKADRVVGHHGASEALVLSVAGVTAITLIANLILLILYWAPAQTTKPLGDTKPMALLYRLKNAEAWITPPTARRRLLGLPGASWWSTKGRVSVRSRSKTGEPSRNFDGFPCFCRSRRRVTHSSWEATDHADGFRRGIQTETRGARWWADRNHDNVSLRYPLPRLAYAGVWSLWAVAREPTSASNVPRDASGHDPSSATSPLIAALALPRNALLEIALGKT